MQSWMEVGKWAVTADPGGMPVWCAWLSYSLLVEVAVAIALTSFIVVAMSTGVLYLRHSIYALSPLTVLTDTSHPPTTTARSVPCSNRSPGYKFLSSSYSQHGPILSATLHWSSYHFWQRKKPLLRRASDVYLALTRPLKGDGCKTVASKI